MNRLAALVTFALLAMCVSTHADDLVADGAMTEVSVPIGKLIHLKWTDERIAIDREHWEASIGNETEEEKAEEKAEEEEKIAEMVKRGMPEDFARRMAQRRIGSFLTASPEGELFEELKIAAGAGSGGGSGGEETHWHGRGNNVFLTMNSNSDQTAFRFAFMEKEAPFQEFVFEDHFRKGLRIQFSSDDQQLLFSQTPGGRVRVAHILKERSVAFQHDNYEQMVERQPEFAADFHSLLEKLGINRPMTKRDPQVIQTVGELLLKPDAAVVRGANEAIARLGADTYAAREQAQKVLVENFAAWRHVIRDKLTDSGIDPESRMRLKSVMDNPEFKADDAELYIKQRKLLTDVNYLTSILSDAPESLHECISNRITELKSK